MYVHTLVSIFTIFFSVVPAASDSVCYFHDGTIHGNGQPCDPDAEVSHCCQQNTHVCLSNLLCFDIDNNHVIEGMVLPQRRIAGLLTLS